MEIIIINKNRGLTALYDGDEYIIHSSYYGVVAQSNKIERHYDENSRERSVHICFDICEWFGYWSLSDAISRGIRKLERRYIEDKQVDIEFIVQNGEQNHLKRHLKMSTEKY